MASVEDNAKAIERIYRNKYKLGEWANITDLAEHLDLTPSQFSDAIRHLSRHMPGFTAAPESNLKALTRMDHLYAAFIGGQHKHIISFDR